MKLGTGFPHFPMGLLRLSDYIGNDTVAFILGVLESRLGDPRYRPAPILQTLTEQNRLGDKTRRGFFEYPQPH